jgi:L-fuculose-phosphate aldolase
MEISGGHRSMWESEKKMVLEAALQMVQKGLVVGNMGNVSMRLVEPKGRELVAITPSGQYRDLLNSSDIVVVDFDGKIAEGKLKPSAEVMLHVEIYKVRKEVNAIVHSHSIFGSVAAVAGLEIPAILYDQVVCLGGEIKMAEYALSGSQELVRNVVSALGSRNAALMANHGALSVGRDLRDALTNGEMLEKTAKVYIYSLGLGKVNLIPKH